MELKEIYKDYLVSNDGRVFTKLRTGNAPYRELKKELLWTGYERVYVAGKKRLVHVLVLEAFVGPCPSRNHEARHMDGNKRNNHASNLLWGTPYDNAIDKRDLVGGKKLTWDDVNEIKRLLTETNLFQWQIAERFGVTRTTIWEIKTGRTWQERSSS